MSLEAEASPPERFRTLLDARLSDFALSLGRRELDRIALFLAELDGWRRRINLTGRLSAEELAAHALESAFGSSLLAPDLRVVDIGTGGGFPGVPIAICRPDLEVTWLEPREKRAAFLRHLLRTLEISNARVAVGRVQDLLAGQYHAATARAVGNIARAIGQAEFLEPNGALLAWTTEAESLAGLLGPAFSLETILEIPASRNRAIALYRRR